MMTLVRVCLSLVIVVVVNLGPTFATERVGAKFEYIPACYRDTESISFSSTLNRCNNPLYKTCLGSSNDHFCCGPDHYCCNLNNACCRDTSWNRYEVTAVVCGSLAWLFIVIVMGLCTGPTLWKKIRGPVGKSKIHPQVTKKRQESTI